VVLKEAILNGSLYKARPDKLDIEVLLLSGVTWIALCCIYELLSSNNLFASFC
jgi:hypothetical protein